MRGVGTAARRLAGAAAIALVLTAAAAGGGEARPVGAGVGPRSRMLTHPVTTAARSSGWSA